MESLISWQGKTENIGIKFEYEKHDFDSSNSEYNDYLEIEDWVDEIPEVQRKDYSIAVACGAISGIIDIFFVGEFSLEKANTWGKEETNRFVMTIARTFGCKSEDLSGAISFLEKRYRWESDKATPVFGGGKQHHLRDFSHHCSLGGLVCALYTQFTGKVIGTNTAGEIITTDLIDRSCIEKSFVEKVFDGTINWFFHLVSDMAGSSSSAGSGTGIPGPILSLIKQFSALPCFKDKKIGEHDFHTWVSKLFNGTLLAKRDENERIIKPLPFDLRTEVGLLRGIGMQSIPVIINECLVRGSYFVRSLYNALKEKSINTFSDLKTIDFTALLSFNNPIIRRMTTVSSGVFCLVDVSDAFIEARLKSGEIKSQFVQYFVARINIVGIGRFCVAFTNDIKGKTREYSDFRERRKRAIAEYERKTAGLISLPLSFEQMRVLYSLEKLSLEKDIENTNNESQKKQKTQWNEEWQSQLMDGLWLSEESKKQYFLDLKGIQEFYNNTSNEDYIKHLIAIEALLFVPYYSLNGIANEEIKGKDKLYNKKRIKSFVKNNQEYLLSDFCQKQNLVSPEDLNAFLEEYINSLKAIDPYSWYSFISSIKPKNDIITTYSYSENLTGEIIGFLSSVLASIITKIIINAIRNCIIHESAFSDSYAFEILSNEKYVLNQCCKIVSFSKLVLKEMCGDATAIQDIRNGIEKCIGLLNNKKDTIKERGKNKSEKAESSSIKKSIKYLTRTDEELLKLQNSILYTAVTE